MKKTRLKKVVRVAKIIFLILGIAIILLFIVIGTIRIINAKKDRISQPNGIQENIYSEQETFRFHYNLHIMRM